MVRKIETFIQLGDLDRQAVVQATMGQVRRLAPRQELIGEKDPPGGMVVLLSGFACRYKLLPDGRRQITAYMAPGDFCDMRVHLLRRMDHSIASVTQATVSFLSRETVTALATQHPRVADGLHWGRVVEESVMREWLVNLGLRTAFERMGSLLCEMYLRQQAVGLASRGHCDFPFTQGELAETLGLSAVHINRTLQELRRQKMITLSARRLQIHDFEALAAASMFDSSYLQLDRRRPFAVQ
jgi:CRP-like cAMP-binding protein